MCRKSPGLAARDVPPSKHTDKTPSGDRDHRPWLRPDTGVRAGNLSSRPVSAWTHPPVNSLMLVSLVLAAAVQDTAPPDTLHSKATGADSFEITYAAYGTTEPSEAQRRLMPEANRLCAPRQVVLGKYRFSSTAPLAPTPAEPAQSQSVDLVQQIQCVADGAGAQDAGEATPPGPNIPSLAQDTDQDARIIGLTEDYLDARRRQDSNATRKLMDSTYLATIDQGARQKHQAAFNRAAGTQQARVVYRVTWYDDPPGTLPGRYAAADFVTLDTGLDFHCGYIAWRQQADGSFRVVREEDNYLDAASAARMSEKDRREAKALVGCPDVTRTQGDENAP